MLSNLTVTLYDVLGYLLPGLLSVVAIAILVLPIFAPAAGLFQLIEEADATSWCILAAVGYLLGHLVQGIANVAIGSKVLPSTLDLLVRDPYESRNVSKWNCSPASIPEPLVSEARSEVASALRVSKDAVTNALVYELCDAFVLHAGKASVTDARDVYIYREGFYRGLTVSLLMLFLSLVGSAGMTLVPGRSLMLSDTLPASLPLLLAAGLLVLVGAWLSFCRYRRFGGYRVRHAIMTFLVMRGENLAESADRKRPGEDRGQAP